MIRRAIVHLDRYAGYARSLETEMYRVSGADWQVRHGPFWYECAAEAVPAELRAAWAQAQEVPPVAAGRIPNGGPYGDIEF